jgi:hypothetical protein
MSAGGEIVMGAAALMLKGKSPLRRNLDLRVSMNGYLSAALYVRCRPPGYTQTLAYCNEKIANCYLHSNVNGQFSLWLNHAAFDISEAEARQIREKFEPLGLRIEKVDATSAPPMISGAAFGGETGL